MPDPKPNPDSNPNPNPNPSPNPNQVGLLAAIGYLAKKKKSAKNTVVKELSFPSQLPYAEEEGAPGAAPPSASAVGAVVPVVRPIVTTYDPTTNGGAATDSKV